MMLGPSVAVGAFSAPAGLSAIPGLLALWDPTAPGAVFSDRAGKTPWTPGDPLGLMLDSLGANALGPELVTSQDLSGGGWITQNASIEPDNVISTNMRFGGARLPLNVTDIIAKIVVDVEILDGDEPWSIYIRSSTGQGFENAGYNVIAGAGRQTIVIEKMRGPSMGSAINTNLSFEQRNTPTGVSRLKVYSASAREIPGHHLSAGGDAIRPTMYSDATGTWIENDGVDDVGLQLPADLMVREVVVAAQYKDGLDGLSDTFSTFVTDKAGETGTISERVFLDSNSNRIRATTPAYTVSKNGAGFSQTVLPLPWQIMSIRRQDQSEFPLANFFGQNANNTSRAWSGRFMPIAAFDRVLTDAERSQIISAYAPKLGMNVPFTDRTLADNAIAFWDASDETSMFAALNGASGAVADQATVGVWASRAGHGGKTFAQIMKDQPELFDQTALETARIVGIGTAVSQSSEGVAASNNNTYAGRWTNRDDPLIEPGKWYEATYTVAELLNGETKTRLAVGDVNLDNDVGVGRPAFRSIENFGIGTFKAIIPPDGATAERYIGVFNGTPGGSFGHRCSFLSVKEIPTGIFYAPANNNLPLYDAPEQGLWFNGVEAMLRHDFKGGAGPADVDVWVVLKTTDSQFIVLNSQSGRYLFCGEGDHTGSISNANGSRSSTFFVNGVPVFDRGDLFAAVASSEASLLSGRNVNMSNFAALRIADGDYPGYELTGHIQSVLYTDPSVRSTIRSVLAAKYGITLT